ncbi:ATP-dependent Clp protease proteolytic subunit-related protein 3, chloroplastic-like [Telopea speciosissima]|uniref:ATP-dependent Clp protease proteolytic subunit-related protein 3, chloroplastic-like n=1 Tax=Telopea speciosissima TaxID=54955 RepID=UPI001CC57FD5|nr:ATP-dependent Clp protease proteolytic subunit-related protein 3, chloroplastic-like [Telopea speciosissima]
MATSLQVTWASSLSPSSSSALKRGSGKSFCSTNSKSAATIPMPPLNPRDPFLKKLASVAASSPDSLLSRPSDSDTPPFLDVFDSPKLMATPAQVERSVSYNEHRPRKPPPDLPSLLLNGRIVYIGMPVSVLTFDFTCRA